MSCVGYGPTLSRIVTFLTFFTFSVLDSDLFNHPRSNAFETHSESPQTLLPFPFCNFPVTLHFVLY